MVEHKPVITQSFVLGAGLGTRLRPLTNDLPKPLVPIYQKPLITFALDHLIESGVQKFHVNTHHRAERFTDTFPGSVYRGCEIRFHHEPVLLETAGGIANIRESITAAPLLVYNADILTDLPLAPLIDAHCRNNNLATLALRSGGGPHHIAFDEDSGQITDIRNFVGTNQPANFVFTGVYIVSARFRERLQPDVKESVIPHFLDVIRKGGGIGAVVIDEGNWWDVGTPAAYLELHRILRDLRFPSYPVNDLDWRAAVHKTAKISSDAVIEGCSVVGANAEVGKHSHLLDSIVWPGAQIASRSELHRCIVRTRQSAHGTLHDAIV